MCAWSCRGCVCGPRDDDAEEEDGALEAGASAYSSSRSNAHSKTRSRSRRAARTKSALEGSRARVERMKARLAHAVVVRVGIVEVRGEGGA